jgi:hypothetical protein
VTDCTEICIGTIKLLSIKILPNQLLHNAAIRTHSEMQMVDRRFILDHNKETMPKYPTPQKDGPNKKQQ